MSIEGTFRLSGLLPIREAAPCFATPLFVNDTSNHEFMQEIDRGLNLLGLIEPTLPATPRPFRDIPPHRVQFGEKPYLAFVPLGPDIIFGTVEEISGRLRDVSTQLARFPFVQRSVARFLRDPELETVAHSNILRNKKRGAEDNAELRNIPTVSISMKVVRLSSMEAIVPLFTTGEQDQLESLVPEIFETALYPQELSNFSSPPEERATLRVLLGTPFRYSSPMGSQFASPGISAFYAASTVEGAAAEVGWFQARMAAWIGDLQPMTQEFVISEWDVNGEVADLRNFDFPRDDYARSQWLGEKLRSSGRRGVLYRSPFRDAEESLCLFDATAIQAGRLGGRLILRSDLDGHVSYSIVR